MQDLQRKYLPNVIKWRQEVEVLFNFIWREYFSHFVVGCLDFGVFNKLSKFQMPDLAKCFICNPN